jgi:superfamily II DNA or RNA helicase
VKSFDQLERRIAAIPENKGKGDAIEVFAEAYLATQRRHEVGTAWPLDAVPLSVLKKLKLPLKDYGVDGVTSTTLGGHQVYQVKFRSGRTPLTWEELSTFMGLSDSPEIQSKVVITNCDELPSVINERHNFFCIRGSDLDRLTAEDFKVIQAWVAEAVVTIKKSKPFPHQQEALDALLPALKSEDRVSAIMACGTGKTLTALWTTEQLGPSKVLVLLPSLALLRQTLHVWLKETSLDLAYLCVCSDPSVKDDADTISTAQSDLDFEVSTDSSTVRRFLDARFKGTKVIFSTYQSASVVGEAMKKGDTFDLGIFDEAHKTAGREGRNYGYALEDKNLAITKRLFVTATPRHYNPSKRNKEGEATLAFSMDELKVYGPQSYVLSFGEAARRKIICSYKVIISVITSEQVNDEVLSKGTVSVQGDEVRARQVANQIALRDAVAKYGVGKIFTFHSTVKSAASFVADGNEGVRTHLPEFSGLHVSGAMPTARRERVMKEFRSAPKAVISNARCLTEGVDVPAVDMVAFLSPKKSKVDIIQAIGRAMRKSKGKESGYVLIPLYLEQKAGETLEEAVARANFEEVWDILQSLQEQDEVLAELIRDMAVANGSGRGFDDSRFKDRIAFTGPVLALESIRSAVTTRVLERLESSWDVNFGKLVKFRQEHGHCRIPSTHKNDLQLARWITTQRKVYARGLLSSFRFSQLKSLGFEWDPFANDWEINFSRLQDFKSRNGHCRISSRSKVDDQLARWVSTQRHTYFKKQLSHNRIDRLNSIGFDWDPLTLDWELNFTKLTTFKSENGHCRVPHKYEPNPTLGLWVTVLRRSFYKGKLSKERISRLESIGFEWDLLSDQWEINFSRLVDFKSRHGHCRVPTLYKSNPQFGSWASHQRTNYSNGGLSQERIKRLETLGFEWDPLAGEWEINFSKLVEFKSTHGHCRVPSTYKIDPQLARWTYTQRRSFSNGILSKERICRLESLGFAWDPFSDQWEFNFSKLVDFKSTHGHCRVPTLYKSDRQLGLWIVRQRHVCSQGNLSRQRISRLEALGFEWKVR